MSVSVSSYESVINLAKSHYDPHMPLYFVPEHIDMALDIILLLLQKKMVNTVRSSLVLPEPIVESQGIIFVSIPLVGMLINEPVELPRNTVEFVKDFNILDGLNYGVENTEPKYKCFNPYSNGDDFNDFTPQQRIRFIQTLRIVFMCVRFYQKYINGIPFNDSRPFKSTFEVAVRDLHMVDALPTNEDPKINYSLLSNM